MKKTMAVLASLFCGTFSLLAEMVIDNDTITFDVAENDTVTLEQSLFELGETYTKLVKKGKGTLVLSKETARNSSLACTVEIQEGVLRMDAYCAIWAYANVYIAQGKFCHGGILFSLLHFAV